MPSSYFGVRIGIFNWEVDRFAVWKCVSLSEIYWFSFLLTMIVREIHAVDSLKSCRNRNQIAIIIWTITFRPSILRWTLERNEFLLICRRYQSLAYTPFHVICCDLDLNAGWESWAKHVPSHFTLVILCLWLTTLHRMRTRCAKAKHSLRDATNVFITVLFCVRLFE